jgi:parallel beta-helix repeat protein
MQHPVTAKPARAFAALAAVAMLGLCPPAGALTYYVRTSGDDTLDGLSPQTALASIRSAARLLGAPGDRVVVGPGVYREGNIEPYASGTPDAPIAFVADVTGQMTGDPPGAVTILPPNGEASSTGFIVFGRHDVLIEGFTVDGAADAGIQIRPHFSTGVDSTRITLRNNTLRNGARRGVHVVAAGDVTVAGNTATGNGVAGLALLRGNSVPLRPLVAGNVVDENFVGIAVAGAAGGTVADNTMRANAQGLGVVDSESVTITGNRIAASAHRAFEIDRTIAVNLGDNVIERGAHIIGAESITLSRNRFLDEHFILDISATPAATIRLVENLLPFTLIDRGALLELHANDGQRLRARFVDAVVALDNRFVEVMRLLATGDVEVGRNQASFIDVTGADALITDNESGGNLRAFVEAATVTGNRSEGEMVVNRLRPEDPADSGGPFLAERNRSGGELQIGSSRAPALTGLVQDNVAGGLLRVFARDELVVRRNQTGGIECLVAAPDSRLVVAENTARDSAGVGILIRRAANGTIENNVASGSKEGGLDVRRFVNLTVAGNELVANDGGGILVQVPRALAGDCDGDRAVAVSEVVTAVLIALGRRPLVDCAAADLDGDEAATIDELVRAVGGALGLIEAEEPDATGGDLEVRANRVEDNRRFGINLFAAGAMAAIDNRVLGNQGIALAAQSRNPRGGEVEIVANVLGAGSGEGLFLKGTPGARVRNNLVFSHGEAGILLRDAPDAAIVNNLIYDNRNDGIAIGLGTALPAPGTRILNNTIYANGGWGITIGSSAAPSTGTEIFNNILDRNGSGGVAAKLNSLPGLTIGYNLNNDGYSHEVAPSVTDFTAAPRFVAPAGGDGVLGAGGFEDDDFHLQGGEPRSSAIDAGSATAAELGITGSAVAGLAADEGIVDLGFHYGADGPCPETADARALYLLVGLTPRTQTITLRMTSPASMARKASFTPSSLMVFDTIFDVSRRCVSISSTKRGKSRRTCAEPYLQPFTLFSSKKMPKAGRENCASKRAMPTMITSPPRRARL